MRRPPRPARGPREAGTPAEAGVPASRSSAGWNVPVLLHLRITVPTDRTATVRELPADDPGVAHLELVRAGSLRPPGDLFLVDVARRRAS